MLHCLWLALGFGLEGSRIGVQEFRLMHEESDLGYLDAVGRDSIRGTLPKRPKFTKHDPDTQDRVLLLFLSVALKHGFSVMDATEACGIQTLNQASRMIKWWKGSAGTIGFSVHTEVSAEYNQMDTFRSHQHKIFRLLQILQYGVRHVPSV